MRIFVTGGTGLVGSRLIKQLIDRNDQVVLLSRRGAWASEKFGPDINVIEGDPTAAGTWMDQIRDCDAVIHLAGENVFARRWKAAFKTILYTSRINSTANIVQAIARQPASPGGGNKVLINASAIGYYGPHGDEELAEDAPPGNDTMARLCVDWEKAAKEVEGLNVRLAIVRVGVVFDRLGGALKQMLPPFKWFVGGKVGSGRQYVSWIHHQDLVGQILLALDNPAARGPINGTAPNPVTNRQMTNVLGRVLRRPTFMWVPKIMLRIRFGEVANLLTTGQRVLPRKALALGYQFHFPEIAGALTNALNVTRA